MAVNRALGTLNPVVYFVNSSGTIWLPPSTEQAYQIKDQMRKRGFELREADTLSKIDELSERIYDQEKRKLEREMQFSEEIGKLLKKRSRDSLTSRMVSSSTSEYEREFIKYYLYVHSEDKKAEFRRNFEHRNMYFESREYDSSNAFLDLADQTVPDSKDTACKRCGKYRRIHGSNNCHRCAAELGEEIQRAR